MDDLIEVLVRESKPDFTTGQYKVVLKDKESDLVLSIWVGYFEGNSIALALEDSWAPRPMTHDLIKNINIIISTFDKPQSQLSCQTFKSRFSESDSRVLLVILIIFV